MFLGALGQNHNQLPAIHNKFSRRMEIQKLKFKYISPNAPVNVNSSELSHGIMETGRKNFSDKQTAPIDITLG